LIATKPDRRGLGLAGMLLDRCEVETKELHRNAIGLRVDSDNVAAKTAYERHGYVCFRSDSEGDAFVKFLGM
jgi:ribosomal protein S18 acetylase RimI-like enzyme